MTTICGYDVHEAAELFPLIEGGDFDALVEDIRQHGQMEPVILDRDRRIIDGRNRARACERLGIAPIVKTYDGDDVVQYVVSHNLHRRHLTDSQRAMIAAKLATRGHGGRLKLSDDNSKPLTRTQAAELLSVGHVSVDRAKLVHRHGIDALVELVESGAAPVTTAARVATTLPPEAQAEFVEQVKAGAKPTKAAPPWLGDNRSYHERNGLPQRDPFHKRTRYMDPERIIENAVGTLEGIATALELVKGTTPSLDKEKRTAWLEALRGPLSAINTLKKELAS